MDTTGTLRMCRFVRNGIPEIGEYTERDGNGVCMLTDLDGSIEEITVTLKNGIMPHDIEDVELYDIPYKIEGTDTDDIPYEPDMRPEDMLPPGVAERMAYTNLILEERELGVIDDAEAGRLLAEHLPGLTNR